MPAGEPSGRTMAARPAWVMMLPPGIRLAGSVAPKLYSLVLALEWAWPKSWPSWSSRYGEMSGPVPTAPAARRGDPLRRIRAGGAGDVHGQQAGGRRDG